MNVALVCPYSMAAPGGVQSHVRGLGRALARLGHEVTVFAPDVKDGYADGVQTLGLGKSVPVPANDSVAPLGIDPRMLVRLDLALDPADVVHIHEPFLPAGLAALWRTPRSTPAVGTFHASASGRFWPYELAAPLLRLAARRLAASAAVSPEARDLVRRYVPVDPQLVPNGVEVAAFADAQPDEWAAGLGTVVLFAGRPDRRKGFDVALRAFARAANDRPDVHLVCTVGPEDVPPGAQRVHALGRVDDARLASLYKAADVVLVPSLGGESFGLVVVEAMAAGAAVVASDIPGYRFAGGDVPLYVPPGDVDAWAGTLRRLIEDPGAREDVAVRGPDRAREFDWSSVAARTVKMYEAAP